MALFSGSKKSGNGMLEALESPVFKSIPAPATPSPASSERAAYLTQMRVKLHQKLVERLNVQNLRSMPANVVRQECRSLIKELYQTEKGLLTSAEQDRLMDDVMDETFGSGPLETLLKDPTVTDILINRYDKIYVERLGQLEQVDIQFRDDKHLRQIIDRIVVQVGRRIDEVSPMVDARLPDGSRVQCDHPAARARRAPR
jgi:pilus assembly protein CpaF